MWLTLLCNFLVFSVFKDFYQLTFLFCRKEYQSLPSLPLLAQIVYLQICQYCFYYGFKYYNDNFKNSWYNKCQLFTGRFCLKTILFCRWAHKISESFIHFWEQLVAAETSRPWCQKLQLPIIIRKIFFLCQRNPITWFYFPS